MIDGEEAEKILEWVEILDPFNPISSKISETRNPDDGVYDVEAFNRLNMLPSVKNLC